MPFVRHSIICWNGRNRRATGSRSWKAIPFWRASISCCFSSSDVVDPAKFRKLANYIRRRQHPDGYWSIFPGGPPDVSASVKAYFACKLAGFSEQ